MWGRVGEITVFITRDVEVESHLKDKNAIQIFLPNFA
jgi:hypothetical protein